MGGKASQLSQYHLPNFPEAEDLPLSSPCKSGIQVPDGKMGGNKVSAGICQTGCHIRQRPAEGWVISGGVRQGNYHSLRIISRFWDPPPPRASPVSPFSVGVRRPVEPPGSPG